MKKLTAGIFATLLAVVSADSAYAAIASSGYVDEKVGEVQTAVDAVEGDVSTLQTTVGQHTTQIAGKADSSTVTALGGRVTTAEGEIDTLQTAVAGKQDALGFTPENSANKTTTLSGTSTDMQYPSAKAVWDTIQTETEGIASNTDVTALKGRVDTLETASANHVVKNEAITGGTHTKITYDAKGLVTAGANLTAEDIPTIPNTKVSGLGSLATKSSVATADIASKAVTKEKLADEIVTSLGKADTALQQASLNGYLTKTAADAAYADIATETTASTASTSAQTALTNIGTLSQLTTEAKANTVAAINEVATEAAAAATAASAADTKAGQAQTAADTAQGDVDALEAVVNHETTGLAAAHTAIDALESGKLDKTGTAARATADASGNVITTTYATKEEVADLPTAANLALKQDKTDNSLATTDKTVVGAINEVKTTADGASTAAGAAQDAADAAQADATQALEDAATAQAAAEAAQTAANSKLPTATYNSQVGTVSATNMGTSASTVVTAIKEVKTQADKGVSDAATAKSAADAAKDAADAAQATANAAIPAPDGECASGTAKCVLTFNNSVYAWEVIARNGEGQ